MGRMGDTAGGALRVSLPESSPSSRTTTSVSARSRHGVDLWTYVGRSSTVLAVCFRWLAVLN